MSEANKDKATTGLQLTPRTRRRTAKEEGLMSEVTTERAKLGYRLGKEEGEAFWFLGMLETIKISMVDTAGNFGLIEVIVRAGDGSPWHVHPEDGEFTFYVGDARMSLPAGSFAFGPKGVPHTFIAEPPDGGKALIGFQPFQFEGLLREVGEPAPERVLPPPLESPPDLQRLAPIAARNGMEVLGPPGPPPGR